MTPQPTAEPKIEVGSQVRHLDQSRGTVTAIHGGEPGQRIVEWKSCGRFRVSGEVALKLIPATDVPRWRRA